MIHDLTTGLTLVRDWCRMCGAVAIGTHLQCSSEAEHDFVCANCDPANFEVAAESQKADWLAGERISVPRIQHHPRVTLV